MKYNKTMGGKSLTLSIYVAADRSVYGAWYTGMFVVIHCQLCPYNTNVIFSGVVRRIEESVPLQFICNLLFTDMIK